MTAYKSHYHTAHGILWQVAVVLIMTAQILTDKQALSQWEAMDRPFLTIGHSLIAVDRVLRQIVPHWDNKWPQQFAAVGTWSISWSYKGQKSL